MIRRLLQKLKRTLRLLLRALLVVAALWLVAVLLGDVAVSAAAGFGFVVTAVLWWARVVEPRLCGSRRTSSELVIVRPARPHAQPPRDDAARHVAFARALALVAARYLDECEAAARADRGRP